VKHFFAILANFIGKGGKIEKPGKPALILGRLVVKLGLRRQKNVYQQTFQNVC